MDKYGESYGFWLIPSSHTKEENYSEIMRGISLVCERTQNISRKYNQKYQVFCFPFEFDDNKKTYLSVCIYSGVALFGIYDANSRKIICQYPQERFSNLFLQDFQNFFYRNENTLIQRMKGKYPKQLEGIVKAWAQYIYENQELVNKVVRADTSKDIFIKREECPPPPISM